MSKIEPTYTSDASKQLISDCYEYLLTELIPKAGDCLLEGYEQITANKDVKHKTASWDLVTKYDKKIEEILINGIHEKYCDHKFIAEESTSVSMISQSLLTNEPTWIIDPIDGTNNFVHKMPLVAISVAFILNKEIIFSVIFNPILNELYTARLGLGAFMNGASIRCSNVQKLSSALYAHEVSVCRQKDSILRTMNMKKIYKFATKTQGFRSYGSAVMSLAYIARGTIDAYQVDELYPWDCAAGSLLITEAGGYLKNSDGSEFDFMRAKFVATATNELMMEILKGNWEANEDNEITLMIK